MSAGPPEDIAIRRASCLTERFRYFCGLGRQISPFPILFKQVAAAHAWAWRSGFISKGNFLREEKSMRNPDGTDRNLEQPNPVDETGSTHLPSSSRRKFLGDFGGVTIALAAGTTALTPLLGEESAVAIAKEIGPEEPKRRINDARQLRFDAARVMAQEGIPDPIVLLSSFFPFLPVLTPFVLSMIRICSSS
jgi:hypothetical protein